MGRSRLITGVWAAGALSAGLLACGAIVGVEDVTLAKDSGNDDDQFVDQEDSGDDVTSPPVENVLEVALGLSHTCARKPDLTVKCWGDDTSGQTGTGGVFADGGIVAAPAAVAVTDAIRIASGKSHTCIIHKGGAISCWGDDTDGELGDGKSNTSSNVPVNAGGVSGAVGIACGANFTCAILADGTVSCWGNGLDGQLGNNTRDSQVAPRVISGLDHVVALSAGESHACAVKDDGTLYCWGDNFDGQLGLGDQNDRLVPTLVTSIANVAVVAGGARATCALQTTGNVYCWGENSLGQLGSGAANATPNPSPTVVSGLSATALWAGDDHACAVQKGGGVVCWGAGDEGQIGDGQPREAGAPTPTPSGVEGIASAVKIGTGGNHSCATTTAGTILCWGADDRGQIGASPTLVGTDVLSPESVVGYP